MARSKSAVELSDFGGTRGLKKTSIKVGVNLDGLITFTIENMGAAEISSKFERAVNRASQRIVDDLKQALSEAMTSSVWNGKDLVDSGDLMESGSVTLSDNGIMITYDAPHAALVHYGGYIHPYGNVNLRVFLPPRPWVQSVLQGGGPVPQFDFNSYYAREIAAEFNG